jgi:hypothetical protein
LVLDQVDIFFANSFIVDAGVSNQNLIALELWAQLVATVTLIRAEGGIPHTVWGIGDRQSGSFAELFRGQKESDTIKKKQRCPETSGRWPPPVP